MRLIPILLAALIGATPVWAEKRAVVIGNADYRDAPDLAGSDTAALAAALREAGFDTTDGIDLAADALRERLAVLARPEAAPGARIVTLNGRFLRDGNETWFMGTDARDTDRLNADLQGVPMSLVLRLISGARPGAVLLLGTDGQQMPHGGGLDDGIGTFPVPADMAVISGTPEATARALSELLRSSSAAQAAMVDPTLRLMAGSKGDLVALPRDTGAQPADPLGDDRAAWTQAARANTAAGYREYLRQFPRGIFSAAARERQARIEQGPAHAGRADDPAVPVPATRPQSTPEAQAEAAMNLDAAARAGLQRSLSRLGHDSGTADGIFGQRTRAALMAWQRANKHAPTGYLTPVQLKSINQQVAYLDGDNGSRDRDYWRRTGAQRDAKGLQTYLRRYPNGIHADTARRMLAELTGAVPPQDVPQGDGATWAWARRQGSAAAYETYLERYPRGRHAAEARSGLETLRAGTEAARREESALRLDSSTRLLIEERLRAAGLRPGPVDGEFNAETRSALRRYQAARNLRVTGYVTQETVGQMLQDVLTP